MAFQLINFLDMTLAQSIDENALSMIVLDSDLPKAAKYNPVFTLAVTLVGEDSLEHEIVYITARMGTTFTIQRGQEGTTAKFWEQGTQIVASLTQEVIKSVLDTPTSAASTGYTPNSIIGANNVQAALDEVGDLVTGFAKAPAKHTLPLAQLGFFESYDVGDGGYSNKFVHSVNTDGLGNWVTSTPVQFPATDANVQNFSAYMMLRLRSNFADFQRIELVFTLQGGGTYTLVADPIQAHGEWQPVYFSASTAILTGTQAPPVSVVMRLRDDGTGAVNLWWEEVNIQLANQGQMRTFRSVVSDAAAYELINNMDAFLGDIVAYIPFNELLNTVSPLAVQRLKLAGIRVAIGESSPLSGMTEAQIEAILFDIVRYSVENSIEFAGFGRSATTGATPVDTTTSLTTLLSKFFNRIFYLTANAGRGFTDEMPLWSPLASASDLAAFDLLFNMRLPESVQFVWTGTYADLRTRTQTVAHRKKYGRSLPLSGALNYIPLDRSGDSMLGDLALEAGASIAAGQKLRHETPTAGTYTTEATDAGFILKHPNGTTLMEYRAAEDKFYTAYGRVITTQDVGIGAGFNADMVDGLHGTQLLRKDIAGTLNGGSSAQVLTLDSTGDTHFYLFSNGVAKAYFQTVGNLARIANVGGGILDIGPSAVTYNGYALWHTNNFSPANYATEANSVNRYNSAVAHGTASAAARVAKTGDTMTGSLTISNTGPTLWLTDTDYGPWGVHTNGGVIGFLWNGNWAMYVNTGGGIYTPQFGDLHTHIESRASAWAIQEGNSYANLRVSQLSTRRVSRAALNLQGGLADRITPGGTFVTGVQNNFNATTGEVYYLWYDYFQLYDPVRGWVTMTG